MTAVSIKIAGLDELREKFSDARRKKAVALDMVAITSTIKSSIQTSVKRKFTSRNDPNKQLIGNVKSSVQTGKNFIRTGLAYKIRYSDLSKFPYSVHLGNIKSPALRKGRVHTSQVTRGNKIVARGAYGRSKTAEGGFVPVVNGKAKRFGKYGAQMFVRTSSRRTPLLLVLGANTAQMVLYAVKKDRLVLKAIKETKFTITDRLLNA